jgi:hypothetical protein
MPLSSTVLLQGSMPKVSSEQLHSTGCWQQLRLLENIGDLERRRCQPTNVTRIPSDQHPAWITQTHIFSHLSFPFVQLLSPHFCPFSGLFAKLRKGTISTVMSFRPSASSTSAPTGQIFAKFCTVETDGGKISPEKSSNHGCICYKCYQSLYHCYGYQMLLRSPKLPRASRFTGFYGYANAPLMFRSADILSSFYSLIALLRTNLEQWNNKCTQFFFA